MSGQSNNVQVQVMTDTKSTNMSQRWMLLIPHYTHPQSSEGHTSPSQLDTVRSRTAPLLSLLVMLPRRMLRLLVSDLSPMSTSIPSSSGEEELGDDGDGGWGLRMQVVAENLTLRSIGESVVGMVGGDLGDKVGDDGEATDAAASAADLAAPNLASNSLCSARISR